jgi:hypothetical protein
MPDISPQPGYLTAVSINATTTVAAPAGTTGLKVRVYRAWLSSGQGVTSTITFQDGSTNLSGAIPLINGQQLVLDNTGEPWFVTSLGNAFNISISGTQVSGMLYYMNTTL